MALDSEFALRVSKRSNRNHLGPSKLHIRATLLKIPQGVAKKSSSSTKMKIQA